MNEMDEPFANDPEYRARKTRLRAELVDRQMNRDELIDLLAHNLTCYELLCVSYERTRIHLEDAIKIRTEMCDLLRIDSAEHKRKLQALINALPKVIEISKEAGSTALVSQAGRRGADKKHSFTRELKEWVLQHAQKMRGADKDIARELAKRIPVHLQNASQDPQRFIYDTLRASRKQTNPKKPRGFSPSIARGRQS